MLGLNRKRGRVMEGIKPNLIKVFDFNTTGICPTCGNSLMKIYHLHFCGECGQELKWEESEGE